MLCKVRKNIIFQNKTFLVMFYKQNKTFWYQFCNFKHFLKAENSEDSLASSCAAQVIGLTCTSIGPKSRGPPATSHPIWDMRWRWTFFWLHWAALICAYSDQLEIYELKLHYKFINAYARNTPGSICQYKEDGLVSRPPSLFTSMRRPMHGTSCPKSQLKSMCLTAKFGSFLDHAETDEKGQNVISSSVQHPISLIFAIHVSLIILLPMMWILLTKPMQ